MKKKVVWLPYDMDTAIGINNDGQLVFSYRLEDIDWQAGGEPVYNGQRSVIWQNIRAAFADELKAMYFNLRSSGALSYEKVEQMFEEHQNKWSEAIFNEDSYFKYIEPFMQNNENYLYMLQGSKAEQRKWWLYNRFRYIDSKYVAGDARNDSIFLRPYAADDITVIPYADIYATVAWDATITQERATRGVAVTLHCPYSSMSGNIVNIYSASQLASIGDLSSLKVGQVNIAKATRLQALKIGDASNSYSNQNLYDLTFGNNVLLKTVDVRNCVGFGDTTMQGHTQTTVDLSGCSIIEEVYFTGTKIQGITLPNGGVLKVLALPNTITNLTILNQPAITSFSMANDDYSSISTLRIENCSSAVPVLDILNAIPAGSRVRLIGFTTNANSTEEVESFYNYLDTMRGLDESGGNVDTAQVQGTITGLGTITGAWLAQMRARYPYIDIQYQHITSNLYYYNGETLYHTEQITDGGNGIYTGTPTKANSSDGHYSYTFAGWSKNEDDNIVDSDARTNVEADRNIYACYTANVRTYTVTWKNANGTVLETDTNVPWGTVPTYNGSTPTQDGQTATGWSPAVAAITGDTTYTATYVPLYTATFVLAAADSTTGSQYTLATTRVQEGSTPVYSGSTPTTAQGDSTEFTFTGWSPALAPIYANTTYVAQFQDNRAVTIQYLLRNITKYESDSNTTFATEGLAYATKLTSAKAPATSVAGYAFRNDTALEVVDLSATSGAVTIAQNAFMGCSSLQHLIIRSSTMATLSSTDAFAGTPIMLGGGAIYVPTNLVATYKANTNWSNFFIADIADYPLSDFSTVSDNWSTIAAGTNYTNYSVGDIKLIDVNGTQAYMQLVAKDTDILSSDHTSKAKMTWVLKNILTTHRMNATATTSGGWGETEMRTWLRETILPTLPEAVRNNIKTVDKTYRSKNPNDETLTIEDTIWIPSYKEVGFANTTYVESDGVVYSEIFNSNANRIKYDSSGSAAYWWLRSASSAPAFRSVASNGGDYNNSASGSNGVVFGFCI